MGWSWVMGRVPGGRGQHWAGRCTAIPRDAHLAPLFPPFMFHMLTCESSSPDPAWQPWFVQTPPRTLTCPSLPCRGQAPGHERVFCAGEGRQHRGLGLGSGQTPKSSIRQPLSGPGELFPGPTSLWVKGQHLVGHLDQGLNLIGHEVLARLA